MRISEIATPVTERFTYRAPRGIENRNLFSHDFIEVVKFRYGVPRSAVRCINIVTLFSSVKRRRVFYIVVHQEVNNRLFVRPIETHLDDLYAHFAIITVGSKSVGERVWISQDVLLRSIISIMVFFLFFFNF